MKLFFENCCEKIDFELIYRTRKTVGIKICRENGLIVHSPKGVKSEEIIKILKTKSSWIVKKLEEVRNIEQRIIPKKFVDGEKFLFLGEEHKLEILFNPKQKKPKFEIDYGRILIETCTTEPDKIKAWFEAWYRTKALETIGERVLYYQPLLGIKPNLVKVKTQKSRWGTCNSKGNLYFNWKIIMAPIEILDYLVVHEMAHLLHLNHSAKFWNCVGNILPDYKTRRQILKKFGSTYSF